MVVAKRSIPSVRILNPVLSSNSTSLTGIRPVSAVVRPSMEERALSGERITSAVAPSRRFRSGRICTEEGCRTRLSIYNDEKYCSLHHRISAPRTRGRKIA